MPRFNTDVFVVGGGPAGLAAALAIRQCGLEVTIADQAIPPIDKACGEGLMPDSLGVLTKLGISLDGLAAGRFKGIKFIGEKNEAAAYFPKGIGYGIRRTLLHAHLVSCAAAAGVKLCWGARVQASQSGVLCVNEDAVRARWIVGADGIDSRVRKWAGLDVGRERERRIGYRQHFDVDAWSDLVEIYWAHGAQAYVTPVSTSEICVALISKEKFVSFADGLMRFPRLQEKLVNAKATTSARGSLTISRRLRSVFRDNVALIGEASGSVDAITGEGLAIAFRQSLALANAITVGDLRQYGGAHREIGKLPDFMARTMLLMDKSNWLQTRALTAFTHRPGLFARMLSVHVGAEQLTSFGQYGMANLAWQLFTS